MAGALGLVACAPVAVALGLATVLLARLGGDLALSPRPVDPAALLLTITCGACAVVTARLTCCAALIALIGVGRTLGVASRTGERAALALGPRALRPILAALLVGATAVTVAAPANAVGPDDRVTRAAAAWTTGRMPDVATDLPAPAWQSLPDPGWVAPPPPSAASVSASVAAADVRLVSSGSRTDAGAAAASADHRAADGADDGRADHRADRRDDGAVVRRGDSLWSVAARHLGPGASDPEIAAEWPRWWQANRERIGPDPDLLLPGLRLDAPAHVQAAR